MELFDIFKNDNLVYFVLLFFHRDFTIYSGAKWPWRFLRARFQELSASIHRLSSRINFQIPPARQASTCHFERLPEAAKCYMAPGQNSNFTDPFLSRGDTEVWGRATTGNIVAFA